MNDELANAHWVRQIILGLANHRQCEILEGSGNKRRILVGSPNPCWVQGMHYGFGEHTLGSANALWVR